MDEFGNDLTDILMLSLIGEAGFARGNNGSVLFKRVMNSAETADVVPAYGGEQAALETLARIGVFAEKAGGDRASAMVYRYIFCVTEDCGEISGEIAAALNETYKKAKNSGFVGMIAVIDKKSGSCILPRGKKIQDAGVKKAVAKALGALAGKDGAAAENVKTAAVKAENARKTLSNSTRKLTIINPATVLIAANLAVFIIGLITRIKSGSDLLAEAGVQDNTKIMQGEIWRLVTPMFLHSGFAHLAGNMVSLFFLGSIVLRYYKDRDFLIIYFASGLFGNLLTLFFTDYLSLGASGAIMGLGGVIIYRMFFGRDAKVFRSAGNYASIAFMILFNLIYGVIATGSNVNNFGHFGGFICGFVLAAVISRISEKRGNN